jgi:hypothetical protein
LACAASIGQKQQTSDVPQARHPEKGCHLLKVALDLQRASDAATETLQAELTDVQPGLTAFQGQQLAELCIEKNLVASLKNELATAYVPSIPLPQMLDGLAASVEQLVTCTSKPGCHLMTKVKVICERVYAFDNF